MGTDGGDHATGVTAPDSGVLWADAGARGRWAEELHGHHADGGHLSVLRPSTPLTFLLSHPSPL